MLSVFRCCHQWKHTHTHTLSLAHTQCHCVLILLYILVLFILMLISTTECSNITSSNMMYIPMEREKKCCKMILKRYYVHGVLCAPIYTIIKINFIWLLKVIMQTIIIFSISFEYLLYYYNVIQLHCVQANDCSEALNNKSSMQAGLTFRMHQCNTNKKRF